MVHHMLDLFFCRIQARIGHVVRNVSQGCTQELGHRYIRDIEVAKRQLRRMRYLFTEQNEEIYIDLLRILDDISQVLVQNVNVIRTTAIGLRHTAVTQQQLQFLLQNGFSATSIANLFHVSLSTIRRRMRQFNLLTRQFYSQLTDDELDEFCKNFIGVNPNRGYRALRACFQSQGVRVQYERLRHSMSRSNPASVALRWANTISRRIYHVDGPNSLWHIDGNHKLIRWKIVVHGGVDVYSRLVTYLQAATNNRAETVLDQFVEATLNYGLPSRVRCDRGDENIHVSEFMEILRGSDRGSFIPGRSVHNQRIERLWNDVYKSRVVDFYELFHFLESESLLHPDDELSLFSLHYCFLPILNQKLLLCQNYYNHHPLRTENYKTPFQLLVSGIVERRNNNRAEIQEIFHPEAIGGGVVGDGVVEALVIGREFHEEVVVPALASSLNDTDYEELKQHVNSVTDVADGIGIDVYLKTLTFVYEKVFQI